MPEPRITGPLLKVLDKLLDDPTASFYGYDLSKSTGLKSGTLYPLLIRLEDVGWLKSGWENPDIEGRPRRRYYKLTAEGQVGALAALRSVPAPSPGRLAMGSLRPNPGGAW
ncbi:PadR family transcriptional regulator [Nocardia sp. NPDC004722]